MNEVTIFDDYVIKTYSERDINRFSSVDNEMHCINKFSLNKKNPYCPEVERIGKNSYRMKRYKFSLGNLDEISKENVSRMLFTISFGEFTKQVQEIKDILSETKIQHRDINPGNILFSEEDRHLKVIDFFWAKTDDLEVGTPELLNGKWTQDDSVSFQMIIDEVKKVNDFLLVSTKETKSILQEIGKTYLNGSSVSPGTTYHRIDIPYFYDVPASKDVTKEFLDMIENLSVKPKLILDVGCAVGFNSFNFIRRFFLQKAYAYEGDSQVLNFLRKCKELFNLPELELFGKIDHTISIPKVDVVICNNVHMWIYKQLGKENTNILMKNLLSNCKEMFFQTAGEESSGMFRLADLKNKNDIEKYLYSVGGKEVKFVSSTSAHGGLRHLFKVKGALWNL